ncbi:hypothetical protein TFLX_05739 [Thermoflexales bacterium]|nr:hypothetical protein TFLX_05739 [Thermoflexales bacterium]
MKSFLSGASLSIDARLLSRLITCMPYLLCLTAFCLRLFRLNFHPIWFDEDLAYQRATAALDVALASMNGAPLYYLLLRGWAELTGHSLYALRFLSMLCGTLTVPLIYQLGRRLLGVRLALGVAFIATFTPFYIYYSQEARTYALTLVLMLVSLYAFLRWRATLRWVDLFWCSLANLICLYTHYVTLLVIAAQGAFLLATIPLCWKKIGTFVAGQTLVVLALVPWLWRVQNALLRVVAPADSTVLDPWSILARTWIEFGVGRAIAPPFSLYLAGVPLFLALAGLLSLFAKPSFGRATTSPWTESRLILLIWLIVPLAGTMLLPRASVRFSPKYLIAITPVFYLLVLLGLRALHQESRVLFMAGLALLIGIWLLALGDYYLQPLNKLAQRSTLPIVMQGERRLEKSELLFTRDSADRETNLFEQRWI